MTISESGWREIETAPKDGTVILVVDANAPEPEAFKVAWLQHDAWSEKPAWLVGGAETWMHRRRALMSATHVKSLGELLGEIPSPTHWMPLPEPPTPSHARKGNFRA